MTRKAALTEIQKFYAGSNILITGGTGFLGKALIEKLLRACPEIGNIYTIVRNKGDKDANTRIKEMFDSALFQRVLKDNPKCYNKVVPLYGDVSRPGLDLSENNRSLLAEKANVIIHSAATVKFNEKLSICTAINIRGTKETVTLAQECKGLKSLLFVSSAFLYSNLLPELEEKLYDPPMDVDEILDLAEDGEHLDRIAPRLRGKKWIHNYNFSKAIAESAVQKYGQGLPKCIVRPSSVVSAYQEPFKGWIDNKYGPMGLHYAAMRGVVHTTIMDPKKSLDMVPVDLVANCILAAAWDSAKSFNDSQTSDTPVYNCVASYEGSQTMGHYLEKSAELINKIPTVKALWYNDLITTKSKLVYEIYALFLHRIPGLLADTYLVLTGKEPKIMRMYRNVDAFTYTMAYFYLDEWNFHNTKTRQLWSRVSSEDKALFPFDVSAVTHEGLVETQHIGIRTHLLNDDISTLPEARKKWNRLYYMHQGVKTLYGATAVSMLWWPANLLFNIVF